MNYSSFIGGSVLRGIRGFCCAFSVLTALFCAYSELSGTFALSGSGLRGFLKIRADFGFEGRFCADFALRLHNRRVDDIFVSSRREIMLHLSVRINFKLAIPVTEYT